MSDNRPWSVAARVAQWIVDLDDELPERVEQATIDTLIDTLGLACAARRSDYVEALLKSWTEPGACTVIGRRGRLAPTAAAMVNGTAAHGEDFDNTFEGCPVHPGAVVVPAVLAAAESRALVGVDVLRGIAVGQELMCRMGLVAQQGIHAAGFHPTAVIGALGATAAVAGALRLPVNATVNAFGIAGSMASGIIEYLADGTSTKRMHAGWAAQSGLRAVAMAEHGFTGPATVFEGEHGFFRAFSPSVTADYGLLTEDLGARWRAADVAFKPYASGTMTQPFIDCALSLRREGLDIRKLAALHCRVGAGTVHRLWEPLALKRAPPNAYAAKFSTPYCIAVALVAGAAGLAEFTTIRIRDPAVLDVARRVDYEVDPEDEYPRNYSGYLRAVLVDGQESIARQPHLRGGVRERLSRAELLRKCTANLEYGGMDPELGSMLERFAEALRGAAAPIALDWLAPAA